MDPMAHPLTGDPTTFLKRLATGSFLTPEAVDPAAYFSWEELNRVLNFSEGVPNLIVDWRTSEAPSVAAVVEGLQGSATMHFQHIERYSPVAARTCGELSTLLKEPVRCNVFLSPSSAHPGFSYHRDLVDAVVVQISGQKQWQVWDGPRLTGPDDVSEAEQAPDLDVVLSPGDVLVVRRGDWHKPLAVGHEASLHLSFGIERTTEQEFSRWLVEQAANELDGICSMPWAVD